MLIHVHTPVYIPRCALYWSWLRHATLQEVVLPSPTFMSFLAFFLAVSPSSSSEPLKAIRHSYISYTVFTAVYPRPLCHKAEMASLSAKLTLAIGVLATGTQAFWRMNCDFIEIGRIDPIINPGGLAAHAHTIVGGSSASPSILKLLDHY